MENSHGKDLATHNSKVASLFTEVIEMDHFKKTCYWLFHLVSQFHTGLVLLRDSKKSPSYCTSSKVRSHAGPLKTKKLQQLTRTPKFATKRQLKVLATAKSKGGIFR